MSEPSSSPAQMRWAGIDPNLRGILCMILGMAVFVGNDAFVKILRETLPVSEVIAMRGMIATPMVALAALAMEGLASFRHALKPKVLLRGGLDAGATILFIASIGHLPLANVTAINLSAPLMITALAVVMFRERVGWRRWTAIMTGFGGVLLIVQPGTDGFNIWSLGILVATFVYCFRDLVTHAIDPGTPSISVTLTTALLVCLTGFATSPAETWQPIDTSAWLMIAAAAILLAIGYFFMVMSMRLGAVSVVAPFRYVALIWGILLGWAVWGDLPNATAVLGIVTLVGSGLYLIRRTARVKSQADAGPDTVRD